MPLTPGHSYLAHITFTQLVDTEPEKLTRGTCVSGDDYSSSNCLVCSWFLRSTNRAVILENMKIGNL